ncbi:MAG: hypothetical protein V7K89_01410 [Nostoc sp.]
MIFINKIIIFALNNQMAGAVRKSDRIRKSRATRLKATSEEATIKDAITA